MENEILVSICIPTFNRAKYLDSLLTSIVTQAGFDKSVEIVISDNCSDDNTQVVAKRYTTMYENVLYFRNTENVGMENNFISALSSGSGKFLKLVNDYAIFEPGSIMKIKSLISEHSVNKPVIFFGNNNVDVQVDFQEINSLNEFVSKVSYWSTWISCFGIWKEYYAQIDKDQHQGFMFFHTSVLFQNILAAEKAFVDNTNYLTFQNVESKGGYSLFEVFLNGYIDKVLLKAVTLGHITRGTFRTEKIKFMEYFLFPWYRRVGESKYGNGFNDRGAIYMMYTHYWSNWQFYIQILKIVTRRLVKFVRND